MMERCVSIQQGPCDWEIIQQNGGFADIALQGTYEAIKGFEDAATVHLQMVDESAEDVVIAWQEAEIIGKNQWKTTLKKVPAGGLYRIESCVWNDKSRWIEVAAKGQNIHHIGVGDVFIIAGQSNAAGVGRGSITDAPELGVHVLRSCERWDLATHPLHDTRSRHSPFLAFAKKLKKALHYPIGLIPCAYGGSNLDSWLRERKGKWYLEMVDVIHKYHLTAKAVLWYQGCSDAYEQYAHDYYNRFSLFVECVREDLCNPGLPILTFQLNRHTDKPVDPREGEYYDTIRESQRQAEKRLNNVYVVPTIDAKLSDGIHNSSSANVMLGERMAKKALNSIYHVHPPYNAPDIREAVMSGPHTVDLIFDHVESEIMCFHVAPKKLPIKIEDAKGIVPIREYSINVNVIRLELERDLAKSACVSGQYGANPHGLIQDMGSQLPMLCFSKVKIVQ